MKLTRVEEKSTLFGYRAPLDDAGVPLVPDGGVPEALSGMPGSLTQPAITPAATQPPVPVPMTTPAPEQPPPATTRTTAVTAHLSVRCPRT